MEKKIIGIMLSLVVVAVVVVAVVMVAAGGFKKSGGFTKLFDSLEYSGNLTYQQYLEIPDDWEVGDKKQVSDTIVDMYYYRTTVQQTSVFITTMYFVYMGDKWNDPSEGTWFRVPNADTHGDSTWITVNHGLFSLQVSSATNLSDHYDIGDVIELETTIVLANDDSPDGSLAFGLWAVTDTV
ncbi:TPA: hypothetical protein HA259_00035 [Thermoplasmata archaeon]|nr:hypothetical protein [Thermoplasmata archaeon]